jgi:homospermidine synthase
MPLSSAWESIDMNATSSGNGPVHARFDGPIVMVGFGSIGNGTLPLIERHIALDRAKFVVIAPDVASPSLRAGPTIANEFRNLVK